MLPECTGFARIPFSLSMKLAVRDCQVAALSADAGAVSILHRSMLKVMLRTVMSLPSITKMPLPAQLLSLERGALAGGFDGQPASAADGAVGVLAWRDSDGVAARAPAAASLGSLNRCVGPTSSTPPPPSQSTQPASSTSRLDIAIFLVNHRRSLRRLYTGNLRDGKRRHTAARKVGVSC